MGCFNLGRFKNFLRRRGINARDGRDAPTPMPLEETSSRVASLAQSSPSPAGLRTPQSRTEQYQPTSLTSPLAPDRAPSPTLTGSASSPLSQTTISRPEAGQSLWNRAYDALREDNAQLLGRYEKLLSRELAENDTAAAAASQGIPGESDLDRAENYIKTDPDTRRAQLMKITDQGMHRADEKQTRYTIFGHEFVLKDQVAQAAQFVKAVKGLVDEAVKVSPEVSLAWAGVCVLLPVLKNPIAVEEANRDGLPYVTSRIRYYVELEHLLWPENLERQYLKEQFEHHIIELYQHILEFQIKTALRLYQTWLANMGRDVTRYDDWSEMVSKIKDLEQIIREESSMLNTIASRQSLGDLHETAKGHYDSMQSLLSVTKKQLQISMEHRDISSEQLDEQNLANTLLLFSPVQSQVRQEFWDQRMPNPPPIEGVNIHWDSHQQTLEGHNDQVTSVAFSPDGQMLASGSRDQTVRLWDVAKAAQKQILKGHDDQVTSVAFSPDGQTLASGSFDKTVRLWDVATCAQKQVLKGHYDWVTSVAFSPDGQMLASGSCDQTARLWDIAKAAQKQILKGHDGWVTSVAFSPDGQTLVSGSWDKTVRLWDVATGTQKQRLEGHNERVVSVALSPKGQMLASGSYDNTVRLWDIATGAQKQVLEGFTRNLTFKPLSSPQLVTDFGTFDLPPGPPSSKASTPEEPTAQLVIDEISLRLDDNWIMKGNKRIIRLPDEWRPTALAVRDTIICIGTDSGDIYWVTDS